MGGVAYLTWGLLVCVKLNVPLLQSLGWRSNNRGQSTALYKKVINLWSTPYLPLELEPVSYAVDQYLDSSRSLMTDNPVIQLCFARFTIAKLKMILLLERQS